MKQLVLAAAVAVAASGGSPLGADWWSHAKSGLQFQMVAALTECMHWDRGEAVARNVNYLDRQDFVTRYYASHHDGASIERVLSREPNGRDKPDDGGAEWTEARGGFDGEYWGQMSGEEQQTFILGYLSCRTGAVPAPDKVRSVATKVDAWFNDGKHANARTHAKIADALATLGVVAPRAHHAKR
jgi:hypothetical protein